jgi:hypothetical protein
MMTALIIFLGLSSCATMFILAAVIVGARRATVHNVAPAAQTAEAGSRSSVFAYGH